MYFRPVMIINQYEFSLAEDIKTMNVPPNQKHAKKVAW